MLMTGVLSCVYDVFVADGLPFRLAMRSWSRYGCMAYELGLRSVNNLKLTCDGRLTFWDTPKKTHKSPKLPLLRQSKEWELFSVLPCQAKEEFLSGLGSSHVAKSENVSELYEPPTLRGSKGITSQGRSSVRQAAAALEIKYGLKQLSFLTCTLPPEALAAYSGQTWAEVVHRFQKKLKYHLQRAGLPPHVLMVTEIQMHRWKAERGRPPVHLHCLLVGRLPNQGWAFSPSWFQDAWKQVCQSVWGVRSDWSASTRVEQLRHSSVNYLGKYMTKGAGAIEGQCLGTLPSAWYSITNSLRKIYKSLEVRISGYATHSVYEYFYSSQEWLWQKSVWSEEMANGCFYLFAWICQLKSRADWEELYSSLRFGQDLARG